MPVNDALDGGQADAGAREFAGGVQPLEYPKQFRRVGHVEAGSIVTNEKRRVFPGLKTEFDSGIWLPGGKLPGVGQEVVERDAQQALVPGGVQIRGDDKFDVSVG